MLDLGASSNTLGLALNGSGTGNVIADNTYDGVILFNTNTVGNTIRGNSIFGNGGLGINLAASGGGAGPNGLEKRHGRLTSAAVYTNDMVIAGTVNAAANRNIIIDIYYNPARDPSGYGQGRTYAGFTIAQTGAGGAGAFSLPLAGRLSGQYFAGTATDPVTGNTSEFSLDIQATNSAGTGPGRTAQCEFSHPSPDSILALHWLPTRITPFR